MDQADVDMLMACESYEDAEALTGIFIMRDWIAAMAAEDCKLLGHEAGDPCPHCGALRG